MCFKTVVNFNRHINDVHGTNNEVQCEVCNKMFKNDASCKKHMRVYHNVYLKSDNIFAWVKLRHFSGKVFCEECKKYVVANNFSRHLKDVHARKEEAVTCPHCNKVYKNKNSLQYHIKTYHGC